MTVTAAICGLSARKVTVEADASEGMPLFQMVGYLSSEVREAQDRVRTALKNAGYHLPVKRITVNLAPADLHKEVPGTICRSRSQYWPRLGWFLLQTWRVCCLRGN